MTDLTPGYTTQKERTVTGPEHYEKAEELLRLARSPEGREWKLAAAQVHATLALTAATVAAHDLTIVTDDEAESMFLPSRRGSNR
jgi:hypothetical protein